MRALAAISLGNLSYLRIWDSIIQSPERDYLGATPLRSMDYIAAVIGVLGIGVLLYATIRVLWYSPSRSARAVAMLALLVVMIVPLDFARRSAGLQLDVETTFGRYFIVVGLGLMLWVLAGVFRQRFFAVLLWVLALVSPYALLNVATAARRAILAPAASSLPDVSNPGAMSFTRHNTRVVWVIFDEWDYAAFFEHRPADLALPNLDKFVRESVVATHAFPPGGKTMISIPSLLSGRRLVNARQVGSGRLEVMLAGSNEWVNFSALDNVVSRCLAEGTRVGVYGWYHPYDRLLGARAGLDAQSWGYPDFQSYRRSTIARSILAQLAYIGWPWSGRSSSAETFGAIDAAATAAVANPNAGLVFLHYNVPHAPGIFDREANRTSVKMTSSSEGYKNNSALLDRTLGTLLKSIDSAGLADNTAIILTSDHWWRSAPWSKIHTDFRVPLLVRGLDRHPATVTSALCTVVTSDLVMQILNNRLLTNSQIAEWLRRGDGIVPNGYAQGAPIWPAVEHP